MREYFKGYYFKCTIDDETIAFIPALHCGRGRHRRKKSGSASLQVITSHQTFFLPYDTITFGKAGVFGKSRLLGRGALRIKIGNSYFSENGIYLDIDAENCKIHGKLKFSNMQKPKYNIMGPFQYLPFMQCKHSVVSMQHLASGEIVINDKTYQDLKGIGYIEGDRGSSFPKEYIWTQCHFQNGSVMLSVADIPILGIHFKGIIGIVFIDGKEYRIATYLGARVKEIGAQTVVVRQGKYTLAAKLLEENSKELKAPVKGEMARTIQESICCKAWYCFMAGDKKLLEFTSESASFEHMFE